MTATLKIVVTRPSLDDNFWFEDSTGDTTPTEIDLQEFYELVGPGFITGSYEELIPLSEIEYRSGELRPEYFDIFFIPKQNWSTHFNPVLDTDVNLVAYRRWGFHHQPPFNPFSLTYTYVATFDTIENLQVLINSEILTNLAEMRARAAEFNNTMKFYVDGVELLPQ
jgi:hypothetical protein